MDGNAGLSKPALQTGEGNRPNEFCQLVEIPRPLLTPLCKQVPTQIKAQEPLGGWDRYRGESPHIQHNINSEQRAASWGDHLPTLLLQPKLSPTLGLALGILSLVDSQAAGCPPCHVWLANTFLADLSSLYLHSGHAALPVEQPEIASSPVSHRQHRQAAGPWREHSAARSAARSARARLAAPVPPPPGPSPGASVPRLPRMAAAALSR